MSGIVWTIAVFGALAISIGVTIYRVVAIARRPAHLRWELSPLPSRGRRSAYGGSHLEDFEYWRRRPRHSLAFQAGYMAKEIVLFSGIWKHNRGLWPFSYALHTGVFLLFLTLLLVIIEALLQGVGTPTTARETYQGVAAWLALAGYVAGAAGAAGLLLKRTLGAGMRTFSTFSSYFHLLLLAAVFISGAVAWFLVPAFFSDLGAFARGLVAPDAMSVPAAASVLHVALFLVFLAYLPFSDMFHFAAKYFTYHAVRWDDRPLTPAMEKTLASQASRPVSWSAPHLETGGSWAQITADAKKDVQET